MNTQAIKEAVYKAWMNADRFWTLDAGIKFDTCAILGVNPSELEAALTDDVIEDIFSQ